MEVVIEGHKELARSLRRVDKDLPKQLSAIHKAIAQPLAEMARGRAPARSGKLAGSIRAQGTQRVARVAAGYKSVPYAGPIHFGWPSHGISPQPFLTDALEAGAEGAADDYLDQLNRFLDAVWETIS